MSKKKKQTAIVVAVGILVTAVIILMIQIRQSTSKTAEKSAVTTLSDEDTKIKGGGVTVKDQVITITNPGDYTFSGSLSDGRIVIDVSEGTVQVTLNGVDITSSERDVIYSKDSAEVCVIAADGTDNTLVSGTEVTVSDSNGNTIFAYTPVKDADSVILSSADLTEGETYTFTYGEQSESITVDSVNTTNDTRSSMEPGKR